MAVFTPVTLEDASLFLQRYDLGGLKDLVAIAEGVENTNYRLETERGRFVLTLFEKRVARDSLPFRLGFTEHLALRRYPAPRVRRDRQDNLFGELNGRPAAILEWLNGAWLRGPSLAEVETAGRSLADLHARGADFPAIWPNPLGPDGWRAIVERCRGVAKGEAARMLRVLDVETAWLAERWPDRLKRGAIHADYFPDNVLFEGTSVSGVIDYYFACTDSLAYDLAIALSAWGFAADGAPDRDAMNALKHGYESLRPLDEAERKALPLLCRGAAARFTLSRLHDRLFHDPEWLVTPKDPAPYFRRLTYFQREMEG
ncbi:MAG TPA: homoserine kinase [Caulobacteraceae bacterium]|jgi:homoserine kinase type II